jgi:hypothetical protein
MEALALTASVSAITPSTSNIKPYNFSIAFSV